MLDVARGDDPQHTVSSKGFLSPTHRSSFTEKRLVYEGEYSSRKGVKRAVSTLVGPIRSTKWSNKSKYIRIALNRRLTEIDDTDECCLCCPHTHKHTHTYALSICGLLGQQVSDNWASSNLTAGLCGLQEAHLKSFE